ncbi:MAG: hypothetical protein BGO95_08260 [Micrococcales bacterium 73-13]|nr:MAG: hypothetical protein BGO95_08260 [Micrococcales bacterium 73-13]
MSDPVTRSAPKWETDAKENIKAAIRRFQKPISDLVARDVNEGDTRIFVNDFLRSALDYDQYADLTTEFAVRGEFADYGIRIEQQLVAFIEVKRAAQALSARHLRQVETYAVKEGLEWVILTNGRVWQAYHVSARTGQQVATTLVFEVDLLGDEAPAKKVSKLFHLHRSALKRQTIAELWKQQAATSPSALAKVLQSDAVLTAIRTEIWRNSRFKPDVKELEDSLRSQVIRPELLLP